MHGSECSRQTEVHSCTAQMIIIKILFEGEPHGQGTVQMLVLCFQSHTRTHQVAMFRSRISRYRAPIKEGKNIQMLRLIQGDVILKPSRQSPLAANETFFITSYAIDTTNEKVFLPKSRYVELVGTNKKTTTDVLVAYKLAEESSRSFIFS